MKDVWMERYRQTRERDRDEKDVLVGFNANLDRIVPAESFNFDTEPERHEKVENIKELKQEVIYGRENSINEELDLDFDPEFEKGEVKIGGQAGIMSNFLSEHGHGVIFYTPLLSKELAERLNEKLLYPVMDGDFVLKNVRDASNTDRTKENVIVEYNGERTGRVIFSQRLRGFGPYFRKGVEDHLKELEKGFDRAIVSGFHDADGNIEAKLQKSAEQLSKIDKPIHLEFVHREATDEHVLENILPEVDSIGLDENEMLAVSELLGFEIDELSLGHAFQVSKEIIEHFEISRVAVHTYRYHVTVTEKEYEIEPENIREGMLYGELCAIAMAGSGEATPEKLDSMSFEDLHIHRMDEMEHFQNSLNLEKFSKSGITELEDLDVVAIPTLIHEDPERVVGMGDVISAGSFIGEIS